MLIPSIQRIKQIRPSSIPTDRQPVAESDDIVLTMSVEQARQLFFDLSDVDITKITRSTQEIMDLLKLCMSLHGTTSYLHRKTS